MGGRLLGSAPASKWVFGTCTVPRSASASLILTNLASCKAETRQRMRIRQSNRHTVQSRGVEGVGQWSRAERKPHEERQGPSQRRGVKNTRMHTPATHQFAHGRTQAQSRASARAHTNVESRSPSRRAKAMQEGTKECLGAEGARESSRRARRVRVGSEGTREPSRAREGPFGEREPPRRDASQRPLRRGALRSLVGSDEGALPLEEEPSPWRGPLLLERGAFFRGGAML